MDYNATAQRARKRLAEIDAEREALVKFIESAEALAGLAVGGSLLQDVPARAAPQNRVRRGSGAMEDTKKHTARVLREIGEPLQTRDLLGFLQDAGVEVGGKDHVATLSARLSNSNEFELHRGVGWWFTGEPVPGFDF